MFIVISICLYLPFPLLFVSLPFLLANVGVF
ncbi:MAG: hypothetical protein [Malazfec virus 1]